MAPQPPAAAQRPANARFGQPTAIEKSWWNLVKLTVQDWQDDKASKQGAALAYYTIFSIAPVVVITLMIAGFFLGQRANDQFYSQLGQYLGEQGTGTVRFMAEQVQQSRGGTIAWIGSIAALLLAATGLFAELQDSLDTIWEVRPKTQGIWNTIRDRFLSFLMVLGAGLLILVSFILTSVLGTIAGTLEGMIAFPVGAAQIVTYLTSFLVITLLFALIFKVLPDVEIQWKDVWVGAVVTALLFVVGMYLFSLYLRYSAVSSAYGLLGSILILLLWAYYSAQILFLGAEFTQVYSKMYGGEIRPANNAEPINAEDRAALGLSPIKSSTVAGRG